MNTGYVIVLMATVHQHMIMEDRLEKAGISFKTVVKPRQLGTDCGMALSVNVDDISKIRFLADREHATIFGVFVRENEIWKECIENQI